MKRLLTLLCIFCFMSSNAQLPDGFVYVRDVIPNIHLEMRYCLNNNFVGKPVDGYHAEVCILTKESADALKKVQDELLKQDKSLKIFDAYRPQQAVNHFMKWARNVNDTIMKQQFYPDVKKQNLFKLEYIATRSGHSRGSTVDLTIVDLKTGEELDMGSPFDFFGEQSWVAHSNISEAQKQNRQLLQTIMLKHNFRNYAKEWWHFTLRWEPFPKTYFDFPVE